MNKVSQAAAGVRQEHHRKHDPFPPHKQVTYLDGWIHLAIVVKGNTDGTARYHQTTVGIVQHFRTPRSVLASQVRSHIFPRVVHVGIQQERFPRQFVIDVGLSARRRQVAETDKTKGSHYV